MVVGTAHGTAWFMLEADPSLTSRPDLILDIMQFCLAIGFAMLAPLGISAIVLSLKTRVRKLAVEPSAEDTARATKIVKAGCGNSVRAEDLAIWFVARRQYQKSVNKLTYPSLGCFIIGSLGVGLGVPSSAIYLTITTPHDVSWQVFLARSLVLLGVLAATITIYGSLVIWSWRMKMRLLDQRAELFVLGHLVTALETALTARSATSVCLLDVKQTMSRDLTAALNCLDGVYRNRLSRYLAGNAKAIVHQAGRQHKAEIESLILIALSLSRTWGPAWEDLLKKLSSQIDVLIVGEYAHIAAVPGCPEPENEEAADRRRVVLVGLGLFVAGYAWPYATVGPRGAADTAVATTLLALGTACLVFVALGVKTAREIFSLARGGFGGGSTG